MATQSIPNVTLHEYGLWLQWGSHVPGIALIKLLLQALRFAKKRGALCISITNVVGSAIALDCTGDRTGD